MRLEGKVAIVTGGAGGIGRTIVARFVAEGARVLVADLDAVQAQAVADGFGDAAIAIGCDVAVEAEVEEACAAAVAQFGRLDIAINSAGLVTFAPIADLTEADWWRVLQVNLLGAFFVTRRLIRRGQGGAVVNIASVHAVETTANVAAYAAAKAGLLSLTRSTAIEGKAQGLRANAVLPGAIDTPMLWSNPNLKSGAETLDPADVGSPEAVAAAAAFLASDDAAFITGSALSVDGGRLAKL